MGTTVRILLVLVKHQILFAGSSTVHSIKLIIWSIERRWTAEENILPGHSVELHM
jgi:hypothetical protein